MKEIFSLSDDEKDLVVSAVKAMRNANVLWGFAVGAAVLAEDGKIYEGCNVESWISGLGICAERCAIDHAVLHGNKKIRKIAVVAEAKYVKKLRPCGACLQYIWDFSCRGTMIIMVKLKNGQILPENIKDIDLETIVKKIGRKTIDKLLPFPFE